MTKGVAARRVAVLIDADNVPARVIDAVMGAAEAHGTVVVACAYRHWTEKTRKAWAADCGAHGIRCIEQAPGPNATDIALAIDAVDLLRDRGLDVICVVSGDRDFAPLAARLRRGRLTTVLMADPDKVKASNRALWDVFVPLGVKPPKSTGRMTAGAAKPARRKEATPPPQAPVITAILERLDDPALKKDADGWAILNEIGKGIPAELKKPSLSKAIDAAGAEGTATAIDVKKQPATGKGNSTLWVRRRPARG